MSVLKTKFTPPMTGVTPLVRCWIGGSVSGIGTLPAAMAGPKPGSKPTCAATALLTSVSSPTEVYTDPRLPENRLIGSGSPKPTSWNTLPRLMTSLRSAEVATQWSSGLKATWTSAEAGSGLLSAIPALFVLPAVSHCNTGMPDVPAGPVTP